MSQQAGTTFVTVGVDEEFDPSRSSILRNEIISERDISIGDIIHSWHRCTDSLVCLLVIGANRK